MKFGWLALALSGCSGCEGDDALLESGALPEGEWPCDACSGACIEAFANEPDHSHVDGNVSYADEPPYGGDHNSCWATWGEHTEQVAAENWVHNLEHGGVVFLYDCPDGCDEEHAQLLAYTSTLTPGRWLLSPYEKSSYPFTVVSWGHRLELGCFDLPAIQRFYDENVGNGREDVTANPSSQCM